MSLLQAKLGQLSKKSATAAAIGYALGRRPALTSYCDDGLIEIDNNNAERALRDVLTRIADHPVNRISANPAVPCKALSSGRRPKGSSGRENGASSANSRESLQ